MLYFVRQFWYNNLDLQHIKRKTSSKKIRQAYRNVRLNIEYDLLLQKTKFSSGFKGNENKNDAIIRPTDHAYFEICNSCYWCASYFNIDDLESSSKLLSCQVCNSHNTDFIPISLNESFRIDYNVTRGMEIEFYRSNNNVDRQEESPEQQIVPANLV